jgi:hypothetical protein
MSARNLIHGSRVILLVTGLTLALSGVFAAPPAMAEFGLQRFAVSARNENGTPDVQAGSHPYSLTTTFVLNENEIPGEGKYTTEGYVRGVKLELPPGFVGDPNATPKCSYQEFVKLIRVKYGAGGTHEVSECSNEAVVGVATAYITKEAKDEMEYDGVSSPVYNVVPPPGVAAEFAFIVAEETPVFLDTSVRAGGDYGLTTTTNNVSQAVALIASKVTIWGVPAAPAHNDIRGRCLSHGNQGQEEPLETGGKGLRPEEDEIEGPILGFGSGGSSSPAPLQYELATADEGGCPSQAAQLPLLTNPTACGQPRTATISVDSWEEPNNFSGSRTKQATLPEISGCEKLDFSPTINVAPNGPDASTPTGVNVEVHVPQASSENPVGLAEADVKNTTVTLPAGLSLSPSASDGLQACSEQQIGFEGYKELDELATQSMIFKPRLYDASTGREELSLCPSASKIANVHIQTPVLEHELEGAVYLASPQNFAGLPENPFSSLIAMYLVAEEPKSGTLVKVAGKVVANPETGQLTTTFENTPELPYSDLKLEFFGGDRAPLTTPVDCGTYKTDTSFEPWSGSHVAEPTSSFEITSGPNGTPCTYSGQALPFSPSLTSGVPNINAGSYSNLTTTLTRPDGQQTLASVVLHYPKGLSGVLKGVKLCGEAEANAGTCSAESLIGETIVSVGLGDDPFPVTGGKVYLTGPYEGAPFGLSIVNPADAGPFVLQEGRPVVVRAKVEVNPASAALTVTTNPPGTPYSIPTIIDGIPLQIKHVNVNITRPDFTFNPTSCEQTKIESTITSTEGASDPLSEPFQVTNCASLKFQPALSVSTTAIGSKANGAGVNFKITYPSSAGVGTETWFHYAKFVLPKQLPARLTTIQQACLAATFETDRAACPPQSIIGSAVVHTQILPVPLEGPVYFVSYGGAKFPDAVIALHGYGLNVELHGHTFINGKTNETSATFEELPDVPFESIEVNLPAGPYSEFGVNLPAKDDNDLCDETLTMPVEFHASNGAEIDENYNVLPAGCPPAKAKETKAQLLAAALKACRKKHGKKRSACEASARKRYGAKSAKHSHAKKR